MNVKSTNVEFQLEARSPTACAYRLTPLRRLGIGSLLVLLSTAAPQSPSFERDFPTARPALLSERDIFERRRRYGAIIEKGIARLKEFGSYEADWDSNGASAPDEEAIDAALRYLSLLEPWHPSPLTTISRSGDAILEFDDDGAFGSIRFKQEDQDLFVELFMRPEDAGKESLYDEGLVTDRHINAFLRDKMKLPTIQNDAM